MQKEADSFISNNEKHFISNAVKQELRIDGRNLLDFRKVAYTFSLDDSSATVVLGGSTRVVAVTSAKLEAPFPDRPSEGAIRFQVELSPAASPAFEPGRQSDTWIQISRLVERGLRQSRAIDQEALCVIAGRKVWSLRVDITVLDHGGNLVDACCLAALAALLVFRRPQVAVGGPRGDEVTVIPPESKEPLPLTLHHLPVAVSFALFGGGDNVVVDPGLKEEAASDGRLTIITTPTKEVCAVQKAEGVGMSPEQLLRCMRLAGSRAEEIVTGLKAALAVHDVARVQARVRRTVRSQVVPPNSRTRVVLPRNEEVTALAKEILTDLGVAVDEDDSSSSSSSSDDDSSSSSSSSEEDADGDVDMTAAATPALPLKPSPVIKPTASAAASGVDAPGARGGRKAGASGTPGAGPKISSGLQMEVGGSKPPLTTKARVTAGVASKRSPSQASTFSSDPLAEIAALIAGANDPAVTRVTELSEAVKPGKAKGKRAKG